MGITKHRDLVDGMAKDVLISRRTKEFSGQCLVDFLWAVAQARYFEHHKAPIVRQGPDDEALFEAFAQHIMKDLDPFTAVQCAEIACHYSRIGIRHKELFAALSPK